MATIHNVNRPFPVACELLSLELGNLEEEIVNAPADQKPQLLKALAGLQNLYHKECAGIPAHRSRAIRVAVAAGGKGVALRLIDERANGVRVIFGGNDGILVTVDGQGHVHILPPEGPGDPEVRQAIEGILHGVNVLAGARAAGAGH